MVIAGHIQNGVVVLDGNQVLPEGAAVVVSYPAPTMTKPMVGAGRIQVPLVQTGEPGSVHLTGEQIAEILDDDETPSRR